jgi:phosphoribosylamine--glycine ligase
MNVLLIGGGGREHAIARALCQSRLLKKLFVAPGNPGISKIAIRVSLDLANHHAVADFCKISHIEFVVIGPEAPLVAGLADDLTAQGIGVFGPSKLAAELEGSKSFTKNFCRCFSIPTASFEVFSEAGPAKAYVKEKPLPIVIKADGLASGKGVIVAQTLAEAEAAIDLILEGGFGAAGKSILIEDFLKGEEASFFALCDGTRAVPFTSAQDHKRLGEGDTGPNTGGMGAYSPASFFDEKMTRRVMDEIIDPTLKGMAELGRPYKGVLFAGLRIGETGPSLIEYNVRFGDPETQAMLPRLKDDLLELMLACSAGNLPRKSPKFSDEAALCVVLAAKGYPSSPAWGTEIKSLEKAEGLDHVLITHAGTRMAGLKLLSDGGRVLNVTGLGRNVEEARTRAYGAIDLIDWPEGYFRRDIGWRACK